MIEHLGALSIEGHRSLFTQALIVAACGPLVLPMLQGTSRKVNDKQPQHCGDQEPEDRYHELQHFRPQGSPLSRTSVTMPDSPRVSLIWGASDVKGLSFRHVCDVERSVCRRSGRSGPGRYDLSAY